MNPEATPGGRPKPIVTMINVAAILLAIGAVVALAVGEGDAIELCADTTSPVDYCPGEAEAMESRVITEDLTLTADHDGPISIGADGLSLNCAGHEVTGSGPAGIEIRDRSGVSVKNCTVRGFDVGIALVGTTKTRVSRNAAAANGTGFLLSGSKDNRLIDNTTRLNGTGFQLDESNANTLKGNVTTRGLTGIAMTNSDHNTVVGNEITDARTGIELSKGTSNALRRNLISGGSVGLAIAGSQNKVTGNHVSEVPGTGIQVLGSRQVVAGNRVSADTDGISVAGSRSVLSDNTVTGALRGFLIRGTGTTFEANRAEQVGTGFHISDKSRKNTFTRNEVISSSEGIVGTAVDFANSFADNVGFDLDTRRLISEDLTLDADHEGTIVIGADGITLDCGGHKVATPPGLSRTAVGISLQNRKDVTIENCDVNGYEIGIGLWQSADSTLEGNTATIRLLRSPGNLITDNATGSVVIDQSDGNTVEINRVGGGPGITLRRADGNTIRRNTVIGGSRILLSHADKNTIADNNVIAGQIELDGAVGNTLTGNNLTTGEFGFTLRSKSNGNVVADNIVSPQQIGFRVITSHDNTFKNNTAAAGEIGFRVRNAHDNTFEANDATRTEEPLVLTENIRTYGNTFVDNVGM